LEKSCIITEPSRRSIINDTYHSDLCMLYPPHLLAITALYLTVILHGPTRDLLQQQSHSVDVQATQNSPRRSSRQSSTASSGHAKKPSQDFVAFFAGLNISLPLVATIAQEIISMYTFWERYKIWEWYREDSNPVDSVRSTLNGRTSAQTQSGASSSGVTTPVESLIDSSVTPTFLLQVLTRMRENRLSDIAHSGRPVAVNKMLERTQAAG
jgi:cyclin C